MTRPWGTVWFHKEQLMQMQQALVRLGAVFLVASGLARVGLAVDVVDDPVQIDERAEQVVLTSNALCWEMHRFHQKQPDYRENYRMAKDVWMRAGTIRDALRAGPVETELLIQRVNEINEIVTQLEPRLAAWGDGDPSMLLPNDGRGTRTIVTPGVEVNIPFVGVRVGGPRTLVTESGGPPLERRRVHPNARGSKRSLEREFAALKVAAAYLLEDAGITIAPVAAGKAAPPPTAPTPQPPDDGPKLGDPKKIVPPPANPKPATPGGK